MGSSAIQDDTWLMDEEPVPKPTRSVKRVLQYAACLALAVGTVAGAFVAARSPKAVDVGPIVQEPLARSLPATPTPASAEPGIQEATPLRVLGTEGEALLQSGNASAALGKFKQATESDRHDVDAWRGLAQSLIELRRDPEALDAAHRALFESPIDWRSNVLAGFLAQSHGNVAEAQTYYRRSYVETPSEDDKKELESVIKNLARTARRLRIATHAKHLET